MDVALQKRDSNDLNEEEKHEIYIQEMKRVSLDLLKQAKV